MTAAPLAAVSWRYAAHVGLLYSTIPRVNLAPALCERARFVVLLVGKAMLSAVLPFAVRLGVS